MKKTLLFYDKKKIKYKKIGNYQELLKSAPLYKNLDDSMIEFEDELYRVSFYPYNPSIAVHHLASGELALSEVNCDRTPISQKCKWLSMKILEDWVNEVKSMYKVVSV